MSKDDLPIGVLHSRILRAVTEVVQALTIGRARKLKVNSGEHFAAILTTAVLGTAPASIDMDGGLDLVYDLSNLRAWQRAGLSLLGLSDAPFASFEVKSLPGKFRKFHAESSVGDGRGLKAPFIPVNTGLRKARKVIYEAKGQLDKKSSPDHSKNVFLVAHPFDFLIMEFQEFLIAHLLEPLSDIKGIDSVWILWPLTDHFVVWSAAKEKWTDVLLGGIDPAEDATPDWESELFEQIEVEFFTQIGEVDRPLSPYAIGLTVPDEDKQAD